MPDEKLTPDEVGIPRPSVRWEVPLPWLISGVVFLLAQAGTFYVNVDRLIEKSSEQNATIKELANKVNELNSLVGSTNIKDVQHDLKIEDLTRRVQEIEARSKR